MFACEYVLIRLAPDPLRQEAVNIGVALYQSGSSGGFAGVRVSPDLRRARQLSPLFEEDDLAGLEADLLARLRTASPAWLSREYFLQFAQESFSHCLQLSPPTAVLTLDPARELERLYHQYAAPPAVMRGEVEAGARQKILRHLQRVFSEERLLARLQRNARVGEWLGEADSFRFDYHYQPQGGPRHVIQALPLGDDGPVREICYTVGRTRRRLGGLEAAAFVDMAPSDFQGEMFGDAAVRVLTLEQAAEEAARIRAALLF
ncbi:MAG TPA: DUF3037 domain-containing protein [Terriglobales bacterium]|nr:DUF3037 domain-containing protein [Terriglobales bacterium]